MIAYDRFEHPMRRHQGGMVLIVSLILLVLMTVLAVSAINSSITNLKLSRNAQGMRESEAAVQQALTSFISNNLNFLTPPAGATTSTVDINADGTNDYTVTIAVPTCISFQDPAPLTAIDSMTDTTMQKKCKNSADVSGIQCKTKTMDFQGTVSDTLSGANVTIHQGSGRVLAPTASSC